MKSFVAGFLVLLLGTLAASGQPLLDVEQEILVASNEARATQNARPLVLDPVLSDIARGHSEEMLAKGFFGHESPNQLCKRVADRLKHGYRFCLTSAENLHRSEGYARHQLARMATRSWLDSARHRQNLLNPQFTRMGVGVVQKGETAVFTQVFSYEPILLESLDVQEDAGRFLVKIVATVVDGPTNGGWFVNGKRQASWTAGPDGKFSTDLVLSGPGELDIGQAEARMNWSVQTSIPIPPPDKHFRHTWLNQLMALLPK